MAHKKAGGSTRNGRDSESKRLGVKRFGGELTSGSNSPMPLKPVSTNWWWVNWRELIIKQ